VATGLTSPDDERVLSALRDYSDGRTSRRRAMDEIGLAPDQYSDFVDLMQRLDAPWPHSVTTLGFLVGPESAVVAPVTSIPSASRQDTCFGSII